MRRDTCGGWDDEAWEELKLQLCVEGAQWLGSKQMLLKSDFKPVAKAWASFVVQTLEGTSCTSEIPLVRAHTIAPIMDGSPINVGELIANNIADFATGNKKVVPHLSLINWLCEEAECDLYVNDLDAPMMKPLTKKYMEGIILGRTLTRRTTLAPGFLKTKWTIEWTTDGPLLLMFLSFVSAPFDVLLGSTKVELFLFLVKLATRVTSDWRLGFW